MRRILHALAIAAAICWAAAGPVGAVSADSARPAEARDERQQVLVLLRLPPVHFRPGADYASGYGDQMGMSARRRIADRIARAHGLTQVGDWPMPLVGVDCFIMTVPAGRSPGEVAAGLSHDPAVAWAEPVNLFHAQGAARPGHNDPLFPAQPAAREWRLADLHATATGRNVRVAVIDSQVETRHPDLAGQVQLSQNFVADRPNPPEQHGTGVAGIIAARADNGIGIAGVAPGARLMALRACWQSPEAGGTLCDSLSLAKALYFAIDHQAGVINLSLSGPADPLLSKLLDAALARDITVVSAFDRTLPGGGFPASHPGVVAVAEEQAIPPPAGVFSAPGRDVPTTQPGGRWYLVNGSSYAAAHVSGLYALLREHPGLRLGAQALVVARAGGGAIDACASLLRAPGPRNSACGRDHEYSTLVRR